MRRLLFALLIPALAAAQHPVTAPPQPQAFCPELAVGRVPRDSIPRLLPPLVATPDTVRGLYVNRWAAIGLSRFAQLLRIADSTEVNALVIDVKDDRGLVLYKSAVPLAHEIGADTDRALRREHMRAILDTLRAHAIYPIARIVVIKDPLLAAARPEWGIRSKRDTARLWHDAKGLPWLDPHQDAPWRYAAALACEAVALGFAEVQFDYVRFPDDDRLMRDAAFPLAQGRSRAEVIRDQLVRTRSRLKELRVPVTADVFGLTMTDTTDMGIGQRWEMMVTAVDVILPMMYPSHYYEGMYGLENPNAHPSVVIRRGLEDARDRSAGIQNAAVVRPWYQDFTLGKPRYTGAEVRAQIEAGYRLGVYSWLLWNPGSYYSAGALKAKP